MDEKQAEKLVIFGFVLAYMSAMGAMMVAIVPALEGMRMVLILAAMLPMAIIGVISVVVGNLLLIPYRR